MAEQLVFSRMLTEADEQRRAALDRHRERVQAWFDRLAEEDKLELVGLFVAFEWDTCSALSAAAGDWGCNVRAVKER